MLMYGTRTSTVWNKQNKTWQSLPKKWIRIRNPVYGSKDLYQIVTDPEHWLPGFSSKTLDVWLSYKTDIYGTGNSFSAAILPL